MTPKVREYVARQKLGGRTLDVGGLNVNGTVRDLFADFRALDMRPGPGVDVVAPSQAMPFEDGTFDTVVCLEMLEHDAAPWLTVEEIRRVLKPGGTLVMTACGISHPKHAYPSDYWRFTAEGMRVLLQRFEIVDVREDADHVYCTAKVPWEANGPRAGKGMEP